eukprot:6184359-Pleurochrysis_carterae.AAC.1
MSCSETSDHDRRRDCVAGYDAAGISMADTRRESFNKEVAFRVAAMLRRARSVVAADPATGSEDDAASPACRRASSESVSIERQMKGLSIEEKSKNSDGNAAEAKKPKTPVKTPTRAQARAQAKAEARAAQAAQLALVARGAVQPVRGLKNVGNTCFFNSVLQNLVATEPFRVKMLQE